MNGWQLSGITQTESGANLTYGGDEPALARLAKWGHTLGVLLREPLESAGCLSPLSGIDRLLAK